MAWGLSDECGDCRQVRTRSRARKRKSEERAASLPVPAPTIFSPGREGTSLSPARAGGLKVSFRRGDNSMIPSAKPFLPSFSTWSSRRAEASAELVKTCLF